MVSGTLVNSVSSLPSLSSKTLISSSILATVPDKYFMQLQVSARLKCSGSNYSTVDTVPHGDDCVSLFDICRNRVPKHVLQRACEAGYIVPTNIQREALPILLSGRDCVLHSQTGSGKTLAYLLAVFAFVNGERSAVQSVIVVPTRELGIQVVKVARMLAGCTVEGGNKSTVMALLDGGTLKRHKNWLKADPPSIVVATLRCLCQMIEKQIFSVDSLQVLVIDEVDFLLHSSTETNFLRKLLTVYSSCNSRQTILVSASISQHKRFLHDCLQHKWTKRDVAHVHCNAVELMPSCLVHQYAICSKEQKHEALLSLLLSHTPASAFVFVSEQSEKSKRAGCVPAARTLLDFLKAKYETKVVLLEQEVDFNERAASFKDMREGEGCIVVATDMAARGLDLPLTRHVFNFDLPPSATSYLHRAGRSARMPFSDGKCFVVSLIAPQERFVLQRYENELNFTCEELFF